MVPILTKNKLPEVGNLVIVKYQSDIAIGMVQSEGMSDGIPSTWHIQIYKSKWYRCSLDKVEWWLPIPQGNFCIVCDDIHIDWFGHQDLYQLDENQIKCGRCGTIFIKEEKC